MLKCIFRHFVSSSLLQQHIIWSHFFKHIFIGFCIFPNLVMYFSLPHSLSTSSTSLNKLNSMLNCLTIGQKRGYQHSPSILQHNVWPGVSKGKLSFSLYEINYSHLDKCLKYRTQDLTEQGNMGPEKCILTLSTKTFYTSTNSDTMKLGDWYTYNICPVY